MSGAVYIWLAAIIVFLLVEAGTVALVSIWFAGGALLAMIAAALGAGVPVQLAVFVLSSGLLLALMWPLAKKRINGRHVRTNADRLIGREVLVTEQIENLKETGEIKVNGVLWTAVSADGSVIPEVRLSALSVWRREGLCQSCKGIRSIQFVTRKRFHTKYQKEKEKNYGMDHPRDPGLSDPDRHRPQHQCRPAVPRLRHRASRRIQQGLAGRHPLQGPVH